VKHPPSVSLAGKMMAPCNNKFALTDLVPDVVAAGCAALAVSPFVVAVDKAIAVGASGKQSVWSSFFGNCRQLAKSPHTYVRQPAFRYLACLFGGTYLAANFFTTYEEKKKASMPVAKTGAIFVRIPAWRFGKIPPLQSYSAVKHPLQCRGQPCARGGHAMLSA
jgi:hypothetical protein